MNKVFVVLVLLCTFFICITAESKSQKERGQLVRSKLAVSYSADEIVKILEDTDQEFSYPDLDISDLKANATAVDAYAIRYRTLNVKEKLIIVSGLVAIPSSANGYVASLPDYIGQGKSRGQHPYMHAESMTDVKYLSLILGMGRHYEKRLTLFV